MVVVAIAADTALAIGSLSSSPTLLVTLTTEHRQKYQRHPCEQQRDMTRTTNNGITATCTSDALVAASCIDTVVTLQSRCMTGEGIAGSKIDGSYETWKKRMVAGTSNCCIAEIKNANRKYCMERVGRDGICPNHNENIFVPSVWQAEFWEKDYFESNGRSMVDYAFVESSP